jgi:hypothetical protein
LKRLNDLNEIMSEKGKGLLRKLNTNDQKLDQLKAQFDQAGLRLDPEASRDPHD